MEKSCFNPAVVTTMWSCISVPPTVEGKECAHNCKCRELDKHLEQVAYNISGKENGMRTWCGIHQAMPISPPVAPTQSHAHNLLIHSYLPACFLSC